MTLEQFEAGARIVALGLVTCACVFSVVAAGLSLIQRGASDGGTLTAIGCSAIGFGAGISLDRDQVAVTVRLKELIVKIRAVRRRDDRVATQRARATAEPLRRRGRDS